MLKLIGVETEEISFKRREIVNKSEIVQDIYTMRSDLDTETALKLNPYIMQDDIAGIMKNLDAEQTAGISDMNTLEQIMQEA